MKKVLLLIVFVFSSTSIFAQVGIGIDKPDASAMLDVVSTNQGVLIPRIANPGTAIANPATGLLVFNTTDNCLQENTGTPAAPVWECLVAAEEPIAKQFYAPSIEIDIATLGTAKTVDLHQAYVDLFANGTKSDAASTLETFEEGELNYHLISYDESVIENVSISDTGVMTYDVIATEWAKCSYINVVFEVK